MTLLRVDSPRHRLIAVVGITVFAAMQSTNTTAVVVLIALLVVVLFLVRWHAASYAYQYPKCRAYVDFCGEH